MNPADSGSARSLLDKPLNELTEEDIAQLTREDCRRFLKQRGMRRPSWNKSQAIQQVISLKALLEDRPFSALHKSHSPPVTSPQVLIPSAPVAEDQSPYRRRDPTPNLNPNPTALLACVSRAAPTAEEHPFSSPSPSDRVAQMTIFYGGRVSVYNEVPVEKARAIMQLAASPMDLNEPPPEPVHASRAVGPRINPACVGPPECAHTCEGEDYPGGSTEFATGRRVSLQRYREKRKDRCQGRKTVGGSPLSAEMLFLGHQQIRVRSTPNDTTSPPRPVPPSTPTRCSSIENQPQKFCISFDLNEDGM